LDLRGEDLIDDTKLKHIIEKKETSTGENRLSRGDRRRGLPV
jgi:hypothetical protein